MSLIFKKGFSFNVKNQIGKNVFKSKVESIFTFGNIVEVLITDMNNDKIEVTFRCLDNIRHFDDSLTRKELQNLFKLRLISLKEKIDLI